MSKSLNSTVENHIQHNPVIINPLTGHLLPWMEISGSPFDVFTSGSYPFLYYMDITNSCLGPTTSLSPGILSLYSDQDHTTLTWF